MNRRRRITTVAPSVVVPDAPTLTAPADESDVYDGVAVTVSATVTAGQVPDRIDFVLDPGVSEVVVATDSASPYSQSWTPTGVTPGAHTLVARFVYGSGSVDSAAIDITCVAWDAIPGWVMLLDPTVGVTKDGSDRVSSWADQSPSGLSYDAVGTYRPTYLATGINGHPSISGDGALNWLEGSAAVDLSAATGLTICAVAQSNEAALGVMLETTDFGNGMYANVGSAGDLSVSGKGGGVSRGAVTNQTGTDLATAGIVLFSLDSTQTGVAQIKGYLNGALLTHASDSGADMAANFGNQKWNLFARTTSALHWQGEFGVVGVLSRVLTADERAAITYALGQAYGITVS